MDRKDVLDRISDEIQAEHTLISHRLAWYVGSQSFLLTAYAISGSPGHKYAGFFCWTMPILGVCLSQLALIAINAAVKVQNDLIEQQTRLLNPDAGTEQPDKTWWDEYKKTTCSGRPGDRRGHDEAMVSPRVIPWLFVMVWIISMVVFLFE